MEEAGMTYNPFSTSNIWGNQNMLHLPSLAAQQIPGVGNDSSAFPRLATDPALQVNIAQGSGVSPQRPQTRLESTIQSEYIKTGLLVAVLAAAFFL